MNCHLIVAEKVAKKLCLNWLGYLIVYSLLGFACRNYPGWGHDGGSTLDAGAGDEIEHNHKRRSE